MNLNLERRQSGAAAAAVLHVLLLVLVLGQIVFLASRNRVRIDTTSESKYSLTESTHTIIEVCTSGTLTDDDNLLYHKREGLPPFHILGPAVPADWVSLERSGKFNLRPWNRD